MQCNGHILHIHTHSVGNGEKTEHKKKNEWKCHYGFDTFREKLLMFSESSLNVFLTTTQIGRMTPPSHLLVSQPNERRRRTTFFHMEPLKKHQILVKTEEGKTTNKWVSECGCDGDIFIHTYNEMRLNTNSEINLFSFEKSFYFRHGFCNWYVKGYH